MKALDDAKFSGTKEVDEKLRISSSKLQPWIDENVPDAGKIKTVEGPVSDMGRLDCKTPSLIAFEILSSAANDFCLITEEQAQDAVRIAGEMGLATSPSGAAGLAALLANSDKDASSLVFFTEGSVN